MAQPIKLIITIDGPAGAGKSTLARALAARLDYLYLDTGAIYRTVALACQRASVGWCDEQAVCSIAYDMVERSRLRFESNAGHQTVLLDAEDVSEAIRAPEMSAGASTVSAHPQVRKALLSMQRNLGAAGDVVVEGRDTGTVVFPNAHVKFFMTATARKRAQRRCDELQANGVDVGFNETLAALEARDQRDEQRAAAPLKRADSAIELDTTKLTIDEELGMMVNAVDKYRDR